MSRLKKSSTSSQSAKKQTPKIQAMLSKQGEPTIGSAQPEVLSRPSSSRLTELYESEAFQAAWANSVRHHVAENLLYLRRYRGISQANLGAAIGTSQAAIARIESGQENITLDTLERYVSGLDGRFFVSIHPRESAIALPERPWWESSTSVPWNLVGIAARRTGQTDQVIIGLERDHGLRGTTTLGSARLLDSPTDSTPVRIIP